MSGLFNHLSSSKEVFRQALTQQRANLNEVERTLAAQRVTKILLDIIRPPNVLSYFSIQNEVDLRVLWGAGFKVFMPEVSGLDLRFRKVGSEKDLVKKGPIYEPLNSLPLWVSDKAVALIPGVGFSKQGHRLGFGKGFYDRFLFQNPDLLRIGIAYDFQIVERLPHEPHDQLMDYVVTPSGIWGSKRAWF